MPRGDGTGPRGQGPGTGRGMGRGGGRGREGGAVDLRPDRPDIAFAQSAAKEQSIRPGVPVMNRNAPTAGRPWQGSSRAKIMMGGQEKTQVLLEHIPAD